MRRKGIFNEGSQGSFPFFRFRERERERERRKWRERYTQNYSGSPQATWPPRCCSLRPHLDGWAGWALPQLVRAPPPPPSLSLSIFFSFSSLFHTSICFPLYTQLNFSFWPIVVEEPLLVVANWKTVPANLGSLDAIRLDSTDASSNAGMSSLLAINSERKREKNTEFQSWGFVWLLATQHPTHSDLTSITFLPR